MKLPPILFVAGFALAAAAPAQTPEASGAPTQGQQGKGAQAQGPQAQPAGPQVRRATPGRKRAGLRNWSLDQTPEVKRQEQASLQGPDMPPEPVVKVPAQRPDRPDRPSEKKLKVNAAQVLQPLLRKKR